MRHVVAVLVAYVGLTLAFCEHASAGGLYLTDRGARALGRGGAFVAGADDGQSLWYNPAGLAYAGRKHFLGDGTLAFFRGSFERVTRDDVNPPDVKVDVDPMLLPIPTFALADSFGLEDLSFGFAVMAPNALNLRWPESGGVGSDGKPLPAPTRHSLVSMQGTALADIVFGAAYSGIPGLSLGFGLHVIPVRLRTGVYLSACDYGVLCQQPEQADYEGPATVDLKFAVRATPSFGFIYQIGMVRIGASVMLHYDIKGKAEMDVKLPNTPLFGPSECSVDGARDTNPDCARVVGNEVDVKIPMPMIARFGIEIRPSKQLRLETDVVYEGWARQQSFDFTPHNVHIENAVGIPTYDVGPIRVPRQMKDVWSLRFGGEYTSKVPLLPVTVRAGAIVEQGAFPSRTLTPLTLDSQKLVLSCGLSYALSKRVFGDVMYAHIFMPDTKVRNSVVVPQNPLRPPYAGDPSDSVGKPEPIGNGNYTMEADIVGVGLRVNL